MSGVLLRRRAVTARQRATHHGTAVLRGDPVRPHEWKRAAELAEGHAKLLERSNLAKATCVNSLKSPLRTRRTPSARCMAEHNV